MSILDDRVRAGWVAFNTPLEGCVSHLYLDTRGLVTVAIGALVDSPGAATALDGWDNHGAVVADWHRVKSMPPGLIAARYATANSPRLTDEGIAAVTIQRLDGDAASLLRYFPDLSSYPAEAQAAILSMAWALGAGWPASWPIESASVRARNWAACAANCEIRWQDNPGVRPRDFAQQVLFLRAAGVDAYQAVVNLPRGPALDTAMQALDGLGLG